MSKKLHVNMMISRLLLACGLLLILFPAVSQISSAYGDLTLSEFQTSHFPHEKGAEAVVLFDYGSAKMVHKDGFKIEFTRHVRIKIFKSSGYDEANIQIPYTEHDRLLYLKACTYNLENEQLVSTEVGKKQFYVEKVNSYKKMTRFSFPNVREGSVIEYSYSILQEEVRRFHAFRFQKEIPTRYVHYTAVIPEYFNYTIDLNHNNVIQQRHNVKKGFFGTYSSDFNHYEWSGTNIQPFQSEPLMPENDEYYAGVDFALQSVNFPGGFFFEVSPTYIKLTRDLMVENLFGIQLEKSFSGIVNKLITSRESPQEKLHKIYDHVQQYMQWNGYEQLIPEVSLLRAYREQSGSNAEINLLLVSMLRSAGITADPVILSTRSNGKINHFVAIAGNLDYLICLAVIDGKEILLDATDKYRPAGILPFKCLNEQGWVVNEKTGRWINLLNNEKHGVQENYDLSLTELGEFKGKADLIFYGYDAAELRKLIVNEGETGFRQEDVFETGNLVISNIKFDNIDSLYLPLHITYDITFKHLLQNTELMTFFNPIMAVFTDFVNPWVKDSRMFPIDLGCPYMNNFNCVIHLPECFRILELPKASKISLPDDAARFVSGVINRNNEIIITGALNIDKTRFETAEYYAFREFYTLVNKKCHELILLKKVSNY